MTLIEDKSIDLILTDLPYGTTNAPWDIKVDLEKLFTQYNRIISDTGTMCLFGLPPFTTELIQAYRKYFRYEIIWKKANPQGFLNAKRMPLRVHEDILVFYKHVGTYNPQKWKSKPYHKTKTNKNSELFHSEIKWAERNSDGDRYPIDVIEFNNRFAGRVHSTEKPVDLLQWLIKTYTNEGDIVLDSCMGSGSTGEASIRLNRNFVGIEKDPKWFDYAKHRIEGVTNG